jgi:predicted nucleotide-binding protein
MGVLKQGGCLVLLPHDAGAARVRDTVNRVLREHGIEPIALEDELTAGARWVDEMVSLLRRADFVIADVSRKNPNVLFELGVAHGLDKPFILLLGADAGTAGLPSDLMGFQMLVYDPADLSPLAARLARMVQSAAVRMERTR